MYKIFINGKRLIITDDHTRYKKEPSRLFLKYHSKKDLFYALELFEKQEGVCCMFVHHINPDQVWNEIISEFHVVEAAGGVVKNHDGGTLFIFRSGKWDLPKGKLDKGENEQQAALREVEEECGIKELFIKKSMSYSYYTYKSGDEAILKKIHWFEMKYKGNEPLSPQLAEGITDARWFADNEFEIPLSNTYPSVIDLFTG